MHRAIKKNQYAEPSPAVCPPPELTWRQQEGVHSVHVAQGVLEKRDVLSHGALRQNHDRSTKSKLCQVDQQGPPRGTQQRLAPAVYVGHVLARHASETNRQVAFLARGNVPQAALLLAPQAIPEGIGREKQVVLLHVLEGNLHRSQGSRLLRLAGAIGDNQIVQHSLRTLRALHVDVGEEVFRLVSRIHVQDDLLCRGLQVPRLHHLQSKRPTSTAAGAHETKKLSSLFGVEGAQLPCSDARVGAEAEDAVAQVAQSLVDRPR